VLNEILNFLKKSWLIPVVLVLFVGAIVAHKTNFSLTDHIANKVIEKLNADYSPYGPNGQPVAPEVVTEGD